MPSKTELVEQLLIQLNDLPHRNKEALDKLYKRSEMIIRNLFGTDSPYLKTLTAIDFYPRVYPTDEITRDMTWKSGTSTLKNLYETMLEEIALFSIGDSAPATAELKKAAMITEFDLAFSFAGEDRNYVKRVKDACEKLGLTVYYDEDRKIEQWGKSFIAEQRKVYGGYKTKHFVPFISQHYFEKPIPTDEFRSALAESTKRERYILPIKLDHSKISTEYLHSDTQYLTKSDYSIDELALALREIVQGITAPAKDVEKILEDELNLSGPKITPRTYSKYEEAESLLTYIADQFKRNSEKLRPKGYVPIVRINDNKLMVQVERDGRTLFILNAFFSNMGDNHIGYNFARRSMMANANSENGNIEPVFNKEEQKSGYLLNDFSNFSSIKDFKTKEQIVEFFWNKMNQQLEIHS